MRCFGVTKSPNGERKKSGPDLSFWAVVCLFALSASVTANSAEAQGATESLQAAKIGKGNRTLQRNLCQVPISGKGFKEGELAEVLDSSNTRMAVVKIEPFLFKGKKRLVATVLSGEERCKELQGKNLRKLDGSTPTQ
ncbi:MAG: hypothetical protein RI953_562, partial [Pseudomonadota bacterium]